MDLNVLLHAHQIEAMKASAACDDVDRQSHLDAAAGYAEQIQEWRNALRDVDPSSSSRASDQVINGPCTEVFLPTGDVLS